ncbi:N-acetylglutamate synthase-like GNAT family acetyltransferase [Oxalobacteraceae bacterium GrIS 1.11]
MIAIVPYESCHADGVAALILAIQQAEFGLPMTLAGQSDLSNIAAYYQHGIGNFWVAQDGERVVGTVAAKDIGDGQVALRKLFVDAAHRGPGHGVGQRLLDTLLAWCRARDAARIYLGTTAQFLAAQRFYEKNGFEAIGRDQLPPAFPVMEVDSTFYRRALL